MAESLPQIGSLRLQNVMCGWTNKGFAAFPRVVNNRGHLAVCQWRIEYMNLGEGGGYL